MPLTAYAICKRCMLTSNVGIGIVIFVRCRDRSIAEVFLIEIARKYFQMNYLKFGNKLQDTMKFCSLVNIGTSRRLGV